MDVLYHTCASNTQFCWLISPLYSCDDDVVGELTARQPEPQPGHDDNLCRPVSGYW
jgi:hypothetical protein